MNKMETISLKVKNATKLVGVTLFICFINSSVFGQTENDQIHKEFLNLLIKEKKRQSVAKLYLT